MWERVGSLWGQPIINDDRILWMNSVVIGMMADESVNHPLKWPKFSGFRLMNLRFFKIQISPEFSSHISPISPIIRGASQL